MTKIWRSILKKKQPAPPGIPAYTNIATQRTTQLPRLSEAATAPLSEDQLHDITSRAQRVEPPQLVAGAARNSGMSRDKNEDALFVHTSLISAGTTSLPFGIFIVADGMGGHRYGEIASEAAARTMGNYLIQKLNAALYGPNPKPPNESLQEIMRSGVSLTHNNIVEVAPGGGTTLTAVITIGTQMTISHIGDSRAYAIFLDGRMQLLTRDHSLVKRLEELGQITADEASIHPQKSMLYRALGQGDSPEPDIFTASLPHPGYLMLCSDGLSGVLSDDNIFSIISAAPNPQRACQSLVDAANASGGPDNITVILVKMTD